LGLTVIWTHGFALLPVLWQMVTLSDGAAEAAP
jgi:hypothetical protein